VNADAFTTAKYVYSPSEVQVTLLVQTEPHVRYSYVGVGKDLLRIAGRAGFDALNISKDFSWYLQLKTLGGRVFASVSGKQVVPTAPEVQ